MADDLTIPRTTDRTKIRAWQVCDEDTIGAETWDEAIAYAMHLGADRADLYDEPEEASLDKMLWSDETMTERISLAQAIAEAPSFPWTLASTEY